MDEKKVRVRWVSAHSKNRNISNAIDLFTACEEKPDNPGWTKFIEHSAYTELKAERDRLKTACEEHMKFFKEILFTDEGNKIVGISRSGAVRAFNRHVYIARRLFYGKAYRPPIAQDALEGKE